MGFVTKEKLFSKDFFITYGWLLGGCFVFVGCVGCCVVGFVLGWFVVFVFWFLWLGCVWVWFFWVGD